MPYRQTEEFELAVQCCMLNIYRTKPDHGRLNRRRWKKSWEDRQFHYASQDDVWSILQYAIIKEARDRVKNEGGFDL